MEPAQRRALLLEHAYRMLSDHGLDAVRMDALARVAGVTRPVVYDHFGDRNELILAMVKAAGDATATAMEVAAELHPDDMEAALRETTSGYLVSARTNTRPIRSLLAGAASNPAVERERRRFVSRMVRAWARRYEQHTGADQRVCLLLAGAHLSALEILADSCTAYGITEEEATEVHVRTALAALDVLTVGATAR